MRRYVPGLGTDNRAAMIESESGRAIGSSDRPNAAGAETARFYYVTNRLGSVIALTDSAGTVTEQYVTTPFGIEEPLNASGNFRREISPPD